MPQPDQARSERLGVELRPLVARAVSATGFDLEDVVVRQAGRRRQVRVVVDSDAGVGLDDIARLSRRVAEELDQHDAVLGGPYTLEVTSPGVDRPLTAPRHWRRARLRQVAVELDEEKFTGRVGASDDDGVEMLVGGRVRRVEYGQVRRATVEIEFRHPPAEEARALGIDPEARTGGDTPSGTHGPDGAGQVAEEHR